MATGITYFVTNYDVTYEVDGEPIDGRTNYSLRNGIVSVISVERTGTNVSYQLHQFLESYGQPTEVLLKTYTNSPEARLPFRLLSAYPDRGILAYYEYSASRVDDKMLGCPDATGPELWLWTPAKRQLPRSAIEPPDTNNPLRALDEVTDMDIEGFYQTFKDPNTAACIETPTEYWP